MSINGGDILNAVAASGERARAIGYNEALAELDLDHVQLFEAARRESVDWLGIMPMHPNVEEVRALLQSAIVAGIVAGVRIGRLYGGEVPTE